MADIKEIMEQTGQAAKKVVKNPIFLAVCGLGIIALVWDSGNKNTGGGGEEVTFAPATDYSGYPDVSGDVSTLADNLTSSMQDMMDLMDDRYLQMQEQQAESFESMKTELDNKVSNMEFVQKESISAIEDYSYGLSLSVDSLTEQLKESQAEAAKAAAEAAAAKAEAVTAKKSAQDALKKAAETTSAATTKASGSTAAQQTTASTTPNKTTTTTQKKTTPSSTKTVTSSIVNAVIRGDYGNGAARKTALEKAGYNYSQVQAAVNKKLAK